MRKWVVLRRLALMAMLLAGVGFLACSKDDGADASVGSEGNVGVWTATKAQLGESLSDIGMGAGAMRSMKYVGMIRLELRADHSLSFPGYDLDGFRAEWEQEGEVIRLRAAAGSEAVIEGTTTRDQQMNAATLVMLLGGLELRQEGDHLVHVMDFAGIAKATEDFKSRAKDEKFVKALDAAIEVAKSAQGAMGASLPIHYYLGGEMPAMPEPEDSQDEVTPTPPPEPENPVDGEAPQVTPLTEEEKAAVGSWDVSHAGTMMFSFTGYSKKPFEESMSRKKVREELKIEALEHLVFKEDRTVAFKDRDFGEMKFYWKFEGGEYILWADKAVKGQIPDAPDQVLLDNVSLIALLLSNTGIRLQKDPPEDGAGQLMYHMVFKDLHGLLTGELEGYAEGQFKDALTAAVKGFKVVVGPKFGDLYYTKQ